MDWFTASSSDGRNSPPASESSHLVMSTRRAADESRSRTYAARCGLSSREWDRHEPAALSLGSSRSPEEGKCQSEMSSFG